MIGTKNDPCISGSSEIRSLFGKVSMHVHHGRNCTYRLFPCPICRHEVAVTSAIVLKLTVRDVIDTVYKIRVCEDVVNNSPGVAVPQLVIIGHPLGDGPIIRTDTVETHGVRLPWHVVKFDGIDR